MIAIQVVVSAGLLVFHLTPKALLVKAFLLFAPLQTHIEPLTEKYAITLKFRSKVLIAGSEK
jgi:hypothetical protein